MGLAFKQNLIGKVHACVQYQVYVSITHFMLILLNIKSDIYIIFVIQFEWLLSTSGNYILGINMDWLGSVQEKVYK